MCLSEILVIIRSVFVRCLLIIVKELNFVRELIVVRNLLGVGCLIIVGDDVIIQMLLGEERTRPPKERRHSFVCRPSSRALGESTSLRSGSGPTAALESQSGATRPKCSAQNAAVHRSRPTTSVIWPPTSTPLCRITLGSHLPCGARYTTRLSRHCRPPRRGEEGGVARQDCDPHPTTPTVGLSSAEARRPPSSPPPRVPDRSGGWPRGVGKKGGRPTAGRRRRTSKNDDDGAARLAPVLWGSKIQNTPPPFFAQTFIFIIPDKGFSRKFVRPYYGILSGFFTESMITLLRVIIRHFA